MQASTNASSVMLAWWPRPYTVVGVDGSCTGATNTTLDISALAARRGRLLNHGEGEAVRLRLLLAIDRVGHSPGEAGGHAQRDHVLLHQVVLNDRRRAVVGD